MEKLLTPEEVSEIFKVEPNIVCYTLNLPYIKVGGKRRYEPKDVENYKKKNKHYPIDSMMYQKSDKTKEYVI